jgi:glycogen synthase
MKILILSLPFPPSIGGTESVSSVLAEAFVQAGHEVCLISETPAADGYDERFSYRVRRNIGKLELLREVARCDVFLHNSISLRYAWPLLFFRRRWVVAHHTWLVEPGRKPSRSARLKLQVLRYATSICISKAIASQFDFPVVLIGNPYNDSLFRPSAEEPRSNDLLFVGNLGRVKGLDLLLRALYLLRQQNLSVTLTVVGEGPEELSLNALCEELGISSFVHFVGVRRGESLAREYNRHRVFVAPSRWMEPFGVVALEAIACGCIVVGSSGGGLADAIGPVGLTFPNEDVQALADALQVALLDSTYQTLRAGAAEHLELHKAKNVGSRYLEVLSGSSSSQR